MNLKLYLTIAICIVTPLFCLAEHPAAKSNKGRIFYHLTTQDGLSANTITSIGQDTRGFLWLGTTGGLNRYDGREVKNYFYNESDPGSLSSSHVTCVLAGSNGGLWVGTTEGLNYYNPETQSFERIYPHGYAAEFTTKNWITCLYKDKKGHLWIGTSDGIYCLANAKTKRRFTRYSFNNHTEDVLHITSICEDYTKNLWIGTKTGLIMMRPDQVKKEGSGYVYNRKGTSAGLTDNNISSIVEDSQKQLWVGTDNGGLNCFVRERGKFISIPNHTWSVNRLMADRNGQLWIAAPGRLTILDVATRQVSLPATGADNSMDVPQEGIFSLFKDEAGSVWVGGLGGAHVTHLTDIPFQTEKSCISDTKQINTITVDEGQNTLIGTEKGLCIMVPHRRAFKESDLRAVGAVKALSQGFDGSIWVASSHTGLWQLRADGKTTRFFHDPNDTTSLTENYAICVFEDSQRRVWVGTNSGLNLLDRRTGKFIHFTKSKLEALSKRIFALFEDSQKNIWIGTSIGLCLLRHTTGVFEYFPTTSRKTISFNKGSIAAIHEDRNGQLLVGTYGDGMKRYDAKTNSLLPFALEGLPDGITNIEDDSRGNLWLSSYNLLYKVNQAKRTVRSYNFYDRIPGYNFSERSSYKSKTGELFFGTNQGLLRFFPEQIRDNPVSPPVLFTSLSLE